MVLLSTIVKTTKRRVLKNLSASTTAPICVRHYNISDRNGCLALFDANTPRHFSFGERKAFCEFLSGEQECFFVAEHQGRLIGCGGIEIFAGPQTAEFRWVMVAPSDQRRGLGRLLMLLSIHYVAQPKLQNILVFTTPESAPFFHKLGLGCTSLRRERNYWGPGLHLELLLIEMGLEGSKTVNTGIAAYSADRLVVEL